MRETRVRIVRVCPDSAEADLFLQAADSLPDVTVTEIARGPGVEAGKRAGAAYRDYAQELRDRLYSENYSEEPLVPDLDRHEAYAARVVRDGGALLQLAMRSDSPVDFGPLYSRVEELRQRAAASPVAQEG